MAQYNVSVHDSVRKEDVPALVEGLGPEDETALKRELALVIAGLHNDPWIREEMRRRRGFEKLEHCRKVKFDLPRYKGKKRFRLVYRNDPNDGSIAVVSVLVAAKRDNLAAYRLAMKRLGTNSQLDS